MGKKKAGYTIEDVIVSIVCPHCMNKQHSPNYPDSFGWDRSDVKRVGRRSEVKCEACGRTFPLPATLFNLMAEV